jgi:hypothetical protein
MLNKIMSWLGYEKKSSVDSKTVAIKNLAEMFDTGLSPR